VEGVAAKSKELEGRMTMNNYRGHITARIDLELAVPASSHKEAEKILKKMAHDDLQLGNCWKVEKRLGKWFISLNELPHGIEPCLKREPNGKEMDRQEDMGVDYEMVDNSPQTNFLPTHVWAEHGEMKGDDR
jgi:hypothetical protein